jgi:hypothetical protein
MPVILWRPQEPGEEVVVTDAVSLTALDIIKSAFGILNVYMPGEEPSANDAQDARRRLNMLVGSLAQQSLSIPTVTREVFDIVANQSSYTIGEDGNFDTTKPPNQSSIVGAGLILTASTPDVEIQLPLLTDQSYQFEASKPMTSGQPQFVYYRPTYASALGTIYLLPIPDTSTNDLALYMRKPIVTFAALDTAYYFPDGYEEMLVYNLARRLAKPYGREVDADLMDMATKSLAVIKRANTTMSDLPNDFARGCWYDINSDTVR